MFDCAERIFTVSEHTGSLYKKSVSHLSLKNMTKNHDFTSKSSLAILMWIFSVSKFYKYLVIYTTH